jgi:hypothetical protein
MAAPASTPANGVARPPFPRDHPWDRNFHLTLLALAWVGILMGFGGSISRHLAQKQPAYPLIVHVHGVVFLGWLVLFTVQILLVRWRKLAAHRQLGVAMAAVAVVMIFLGPATALHMQRLKLNQAGSDPAFLSIQLTDLIAFGGLVAAGMWLRRDPASHRRLMLLGTLYITDAGFARWLGDRLSAWWGGGTPGFWAGSYAHITLLMLAVGVYDLFTRRRVHPAWVAGLAWVGANQAVALALYGAPWWGEFAKKIIAACS